MAEDNDQDKTESATPQKLEKAREEGDIPRSRELTTFLMLLGGIGLLWAMGGFLRDKLTLLMEQSMSFERDRAFDTHKAMSHLWNMGEAALLGLSPFFLVLLVLALCAPALLGGWVFSSKSLAPKLSKLNPIAGLKKMFSLQSLNELGKGVAKSVLIGAVAIFYIKSQIPEIMHLASMTLEQGLASMMMMIAAGCGLMVLALLVVVLMDVPYQLYSFAKKMRMSKEEIKREHKESEGDPHVKGKIRSQQQAMARSRMMSKVPEADVIITNPTHFAVALRYQDGQNGAPAVVAKGTEAVANKIRELAREHNIPVLNAPPLARALYWHVDLDQEIPETLYTAVAEVMAWVYRLRRLEAGDDKPELPQDLPVPTGMDERPTSKKKRRT